MSTEGILLNQSQKSTIPLGDKLNNILSKEGKIVEKTEQNLTSKEMIFDSPVDIITLSVSRVYLLSLTINDTKYDIGTGDKYLFFNFDYIFTGGSSEHPFCYLSSYIYGYVTSIIDTVYITSKNL